MKLTNGVSLLYIVECAEEAARLEEAVKSFPAEIELSDFKVLGDNGPTLFCYGTPHGDIILRPRNCKIVGTMFGEGVSAIEDQGDLKIVECAGKRYNLLNLYLYP